MTILIVDDDPEMRLLVGHLLRSAGHTVIEAENGAAARTALEQQPPDVLLMDVMLGDDDGVATAGALLRGSHVRPRLVFLTGATLSGQRTRMEAAGAAGILEKPFDPSSFVARLDSILAGAR